MLENLKGIQKGRNIQERAESTLEKLLKIEQEVHQEYAGRLGDDREIDHDNIYLPLYESLSPTLPDYTEQDLQSLLLAKANNNYPDKEAKVLGMYTGVLLRILTERYEKEGKKAVFTFDLLGNELNYLFYFAKRVGEVMVKNVKGTDTCAFIASYGGKAERLVLEGNEGDWAASGAGSVGGNVGTLVIKDNKGNEAASGAGSYGGTVGTLVIKDNKGHNAAHWAGSNNGNIGTLVIQGNEGDWAAYGAGNIGGTVGTLVIYGNKGNGAASGAGSFNGNVGTLAFYNAGTNAGNYANAKRIITGKKALALYQQWEKELPCLRI